MRVARNDLGEFAGREQILAQEHDADVTVMRLLGKEIQHALATDPSSWLGAASTSPGQQPSGHVVARGFGHAATDPSPSLRPKRRENASLGPLTSRQKLHHQRCSSPTLYHTPSLSRMRPTVFRYLFLTADFANLLATVAQWGGPCVSPLFLCLDGRPASPRATTALGPPPARRLARRAPEWDPPPPHETDPLEVLDHPVAAGEVDGTASDCLPT